MTFVVFVLSLGFSGGSGRSRSSYEHLSTSGGIPY